MAIINKLAFKLSCNLKAILLLCDSMGKLQDLNCSGISYRFLHVMKKVELHTFVYSWTLNIFIQKGDPSLCNNKPKRKYEGTYVKSLPDTTVKACCTMRISWSIWNVPWYLTPDMTVEWGQWQKAMPCCIIAKHESHFCVGWKVMTCPLAYSQSQESPWFTYLHVLSALYHQHISCQLSFLVMEYWCCIYWSRWIFNTVKGKKNSVQTNEQDIVTEELGILYWNQLFFTFVLLNTYYIEKCSKWNLQIRSH
jgi:hypothetical protein